MKYYHISSRLSAIILMSVVLSFNISAIKLNEANEIGNIIEDYRIDTASTGNLDLKIWNTDFFQNNEYASTIIKGYTIPGFRLQPSVSYQPISNIKLEAGFNALVYRGAYLYPNFAYRDISDWKGDQYQKGAHILPFFRAQVKLQNVNIVFGDIYGGLSHMLIRPLYDPELVFTADPEAGLQFLWDSGRYHLDAWIDWRSFIFNEDHHQESFIFGASFRSDLISRQSRFNLYLPLQIVGQHRGGEIDIITEKSVQTLMNGAVGLGGEWKTNRKWLNRLNLTAMMLGYFQQSGDIWPYNSGWGFYGQAEVSMLENFHITAGIFRSKKFMSLLGVPFFGNVANNGTWEKFPAMTTALLSLEYRRTFCRDFTLGLKGDFYFSNPGKGLGTLDSNSLVAYLNINLDFLLWKKKK